MELRILGPLEVDEERNLLPLGPEKQRALLALLALNANRAVPVEQLIDGLWGDNPPENAVKAVQTYVSRLRKTLPYGVLRTRPPGYLIEVDPERLDLHRFERLLAEGQTALAGGKPAIAAGVLRQALALWRGPALTEFQSEPFAGSEAARLEELRLLALEERIEADIELGRHADLIGELESLAVSHPLRERFRRQLMLALYRSGRQAEALSSYRSARTRFVEELGIEPSRSLQELEGAILRHDVALDLPLGTEPEPSPTTHTSRPALGVFVGREYELGRLSDALDDALDGRGRLLMLSGDQGIGKTRIAIELAELAERRNAQVLWGRCYEREGAPPFWPWVQALRAYVETCDPENLRTELRGQAATVAEILPEVRDRLAGLERPVPSTDPTQARFRLFDALATFLHRVAQARTTVIVLDDLHAADAGSLLMLEFVAQELARARLLVVGTYRDVELARGHPLAETLAELTRGRLFERVHVHGLTRPDVARFIETRIDTPSSAELVSAVHRKTEGNPLFVTEVVRLLVQERALTTEAGRETRDWSLRVPDGVREVIGRRLDRLSPECNELLRLASVVGREFGLDQLRLLRDDIDDERLAGLLDDARAAHIVEEPPGTLERYRFTHGLIQETLLEELSTTARVRLHACVAEALEALYGDGAEAHAAELVHHFAEAETVLGSDRLVNYLQIAGEQALAAHAYDEALGHFRRALEARSGRPLDDEIAALLFGVARCEFAARERYDLSDALESMRRAFTHFAESGNKRRAIEIATYPIPYVYGSPEAADLVSRALTLVPPDSSEAGHLLATLGWFAGMTNYGKAGEAFARSLTIARTLGDTSLERKALVREAHVDFWHLRFQSCLEKSLRAIGLAVAEHDEHTEMVALSEAVRMLVTTGRPKEAEAPGARMLELAERFRERYWLVTARVNCGWLALLCGEWELARTLTDEALALQPRDGRSLMIRSLVESDTGEDARADGYVERLFDARWLSASGFPFEDACVAAQLPLISPAVGAEDWLVRAEDAVRAVLSSGTVPFLELYAHVGQALTAVRRDDSTCAEEVYGALAPMHGTVPTLLGISVDRLLGLLSRVAGDPAAALLHFESGLDFCSRAGYRPEYARTALECANTLLALGGAANRVRAADRQAEALSVARGLGLRPLVGHLSPHRET